MGESAGYSRICRVLEQAKSCMERNRIVIDGYQFTVPSRIVETDSHLDYEGKQWFWDSAFHAMILAEDDTGAAEAELLSLLAFQREDGFIPHMNYFLGNAQVVPDWAKGHFEKYPESRKTQYLSSGDGEGFFSTFWSHPHHSDIIQPPILAEAVECVHNVSGNMDFLMGILPKVRAYYDYLHIFRDPDGDNLISIIHPWESGWDNSQRWDGVLGVVTGERKEIDEKKMILFNSYKEMAWNLDNIFSEDLFTIEPVDFNTLYSLNLRSLSRLLRATGDSKGELLYRQRAEGVEQAILEKMWTGTMFTDLCGHRERMSSVKSAAMFFPLLLDGENHASELIENHLNNSREFKSPYMLPTTSLDHPFFRGDEYWRGNVWINVNMYVWRGLKRFLKIQPDHETAQELAGRIRDSSFELLDISNSFEYFDPCNGSGSGVQNFSWNGVVRFMV